MQRRFLERLAGGLLRLALKESPGVISAEIRVRDRELSRIEMLLNVQRRSAYNGQLMLTVPVGSPMRISHLASDDRESVTITPSHHGYGVDLKSANSAILRISCEWNWSSSRVLLFPWHFPIAHQWPRTAEALTTAAIEANSSTECVAGISASATDWQHRFVEAAIVSGEWTSEADRKAPELACVVLEPWEERGLNQSVSQELFTAARGFLGSHFRTRPYGRVILSSFRTPIAPGFGGSVLVDVGAVPFREVEHDWLRAAEMVRRLSALWWGSCTRIVGMRGAEIPFAINAAIAGAWVRREVGANAAVSWYDNLLPRLGFARTEASSVDTHAWLYEASRLATELDLWLSTKREAIGLLAALSERMWGTAVHETWLIKQLKQERILSR